jgi:hypothetical protein
MPGSGLTDEPSVCQSAPTKPVIPILFFWNYTRRQEFCPFQPSWVARGLHSLRATQGCRIFVQRTPVLRFIRVKANPYDMPLGRGEVHRNETR